MRRRELIRDLAAIAGLVGLAGRTAARNRPSAATVVVVGGGFGGATAAKYVRLLSDHAIDVLLIEPNMQFVSAPMSNLVVSGQWRLGDISRTYDELRRRHGVRLVRERCTSIDVDQRSIRLAGGDSIRFDRLILAPGIELMVDAVQGLRQARVDGRIVPGWETGAESAVLHRQLAAMPDGGVFLITIPETPYRCPPAPYERASVVADYLKQRKPKSKVLVLDANQDVVAMGKLFKEAWRERYGALLEYRNHYNPVAVDAKASTVRFDVQDDERADVLNIVPPMRAGELATRSGLANINARWCEVDFLTFESTLARGVHVVGDSINPAPMMPKSGHLANAQAKVAAAAIVAALLDMPINPQPMLTNACYSFVSATEAIHSAAVYAFDPTAKTYRPVAGAGGISGAPSSAEAQWAVLLARNVWADVLG